MGAFLDMLVRITVVVGGAYLGICLLLYIFQDRMLFFPQSLQGEPRGANIEPVEVRREGVTLRGWVVNPQSQGPLLFYFSGNAEEVSGLAGLFSTFDAVGVLINYRGYGGSEGKPTAQHLMDDAVAVVVEMRERLGGRRPVILFGRSLGTGIAALTARSVSADGLILVSPYRSIEHIARNRYPIIPVRWLLRQNIDASLAVESLPGRVLVLYSTRDRVVPTAETRAFLQMLPTTPEIVEFDGPHNVALETPELWRAIESFIQRPAV